LYLAVTLGCLKLSYYTTNESPLKVVQGKVRFEEKSDAVNYRYGFNTQERVDEISGEGNHTTALFWEYDTRLGRRWNLDPKPVAWESQYAVNGNNPVYFLDPNGDFKTKFGAWAYKTTHGGGEIRRAGSGDKEHGGEWFVSKKFDAGKGEKGRGKLADGSVELDEVRVGMQRKFDWGVAKSVDDAWNSPVSRAIVPDYYQLTFGFKTGIVGYVNTDFNLTLLLRGQDPGLYHNYGVGYGAATSAGSDVSVSFGSGHYLRKDPRKLSSSDFSGTSYNGSVSAGAQAITGLTVGAMAEVGMNAKNRPLLMTTKTTASVGLGEFSTPGIQVSGGKEVSTTPIPIFKF
jgi:hypothetical protein